MAKMQKDHSNKVNNTFRYLDDVLALNHEEFQNCAKEIYSDELPLNKSNISNDRTPFLAHDFGF